MALNDLETNFLKKFTSKASFWRIICLVLAIFQIWPHMLRNAPKYSGHFLKFKKWSKSSHPNGYYEKISIPYFFNWTNILLWSVIFQFRGQISKIVLSHFDECEKGWPKFQKLLDLKFLYKHVREYFLNLYVYFYIIWEKYSVEYFC